MESDRRTEKRALRQRFLARRRGLSTMERRGADLEILSALGAACGDLAAPGADVAAYVPMADEPGGGDLPERLRDLGYGVLLPVLLPDDDLAWGRYDGTLVPGRLKGLLEPPGEAVEFTAALVIVPALAVAADGTRLGRGGGSYDRALARVPAGVPLLALLDEEEFVDALPAEPHDRRVTAVVTPAGHRPL
ncbi:hypothetical protein Afil01_14450 [Actinorhabdospora filicis]|uniref:5-formyltetrahydrofolate cyclo-ligase n=1 Tax=Actinorhabdospora filicis TaxID=1785913 RepID=A0A9W6SHZ9_9ACTN|nr:5-formyltetrahydrofolate cyclo-ligase [Actinorhabdospora filicis]GLZ76638.1 hypothetical protein Afil01_14450 [Actinorhabdospora filicis]